MSHVSVTVVSGVHIVFQLMIDDFCYAGFFGFKVGYSEFMANATGDSFLYN